MPTFKITTLGCKVNQAESDGIARNLLSSKWAAAQRGEQADVCIVNTCTVTQKASMQSRQAVRQAIRTHPNAQIVVTGCYAQTAPQDLKKIKGVNFIVGHGKKDSIGRILLADALEHPGCPVFIGDEVGEDHRFEPTYRLLFPSRTRPFLKIQDGCDAFCTYCIVPYARGRSRSMPPHDVLTHIKQLATAGYHEVVLAGIHLGAFGRDLSPPTNLLTLLGQIQDQKPIERVRLSSLEPLELTEEIIQCVAESVIFCRHFHIPLQSGDDQILKKMGRPYSARAFHDLIGKIHQLMPEAAIGIDILIGFPGESETAFENTYALIERLPVSYLHVFPFSPRPGTPAAEFPQQIPSQMIKARSAIMRGLAIEKKMKFYRRFIGRTLEILIENTRDGATGMLKGISSNYLPVLIDGGDDLQNQLTDVKIEKLTDLQLYGSLKASE
jgi:threonylcarbamoyladenosine tRNA methylthiotransferase MtaB